MDAHDHGRIPQAQPASHSVERVRCGGQGYSGARQFGQGQRTSPNGRGFLDDVHLGPVSEAGLESPDQGAAPAFEFSGRDIEHAQDRNLADRSLRFQVMTQSRFKGGEGQLVDAQGPGHGMAADLVNGPLPADDQSGLGTSQQFIAAEGDDVETRGHGFADGRFPGKAKRGKIHKHSATQVFHDRNSGFTSQFGQFSAVDSLREPHDTVIAGMDFQKQAGLFSDRLPIVPQMGFIGRSDFAKLHPAGFHDVRHAKGASDLHQFAPRDDRLTALGQGGQGQKNCAGVVVDNRGGFGTGQAAEQLLDVTVAVPALAGVQLDFEAFAQAAGLALFSFNGVPDGERALSAHSSESEAWHSVNLSAGAEAWRKDARKRSNSFKRLNGKWNKLERAFGETELTLDSRCEAAFDQLWAWKSRQYRETGHQDLARTAWFRDLMEEFFTRATPGFRGVLSTLSCEGRPVAAHFGILADGVLHYWFPAYDPLAHRFSPGLLLLDGLCQRHEELGISRVDLGPGDYRYKQEFANSGFKLHSGLAGAGPAYAAARSLGDFDRKLSALPLKGLETVPGRALRKLDRIIAA